MDLALSYTDTPQSQLTPLEAVATSAAICVYKIHKFQVSKKKRKKEKRKKNKSDRKKMVEAYKLFQSQCDVKKKKKKKKAYRCSKFNACC